MKKKKDILFLCQFFHPEYISSAQLPYDTVRALQASGNTVDVLCGYPREYFDGRSVPAQEDLDGVHVHRLRYIQLDRKGVLGRLVNYFSFTFMVFLNLWRMSGYQAVVVYSNPPILPWVASWAKALFGCRLVFVAYDLYPEIAVRSHAIREGNAICRLMDHINRSVFRRADRVVALSSEMKQFIAENREISPEKVVVIPNWSCDAQPSDRIREDNCFRELVGGRFTVSYFGNMGTIQDMQTILDAIRLLREEKDIFFFIAGHGNKMEQLRQHIAQEQLDNACVLGFLHGQEYLDALQISDAGLVSLDAGATQLCVPSKTYSYMMQGLPLLAIMDESDIVRDVQAGAGMWVRNGEAQKLADSIVYLRDHPQELAAMGRTCRELYLRKYTEPVCTHQYVELFRELTQRDGL